jgi:hypothetical protein
MVIPVILNIFISVLSGILTAGLILLHRQYFNKIIIPWYQGIRYRGLDIGGQWFESHNYEDLMLQESSILIKQTAEKIHGEIILAKMNSSTKEEFEFKSFKFEGDFYDNFLNIACWNKEQKQIGTHNYLLTVEMDGRGMQGIKTYFNIGLHKIRTAEIYWTRNNNN